MENTDSPNSTRAKLIDAGLHLFGRQGFEGTSTRQLAGLAETNIASITYHFGGKSGLRAACVAAVSDRVNDVLDATGALKAPETAQIAAEQLEQLARALIELIVGAPQARDMVAFMLRELTTQGDTTDAIYDRFIDPRHKALSALLATATGRDPEDDEVKLAIFALLGQIVYFRFAAPFVVRRLAWDHIGPNETQKIAATVIAGLRDTIERHRI